MRSQLLLLAAAAWVWNACAAATHTQPHIVFILADVSGRPRNRFDSFSVTNMRMATLTHWLGVDQDLGWNDLQGFGAGNRMQTPHIATLVAEGVRLESFCA